MKTEISAGGVIVRKKNSAWEVLLIKDMNGNWTFPKGLIDRGESPEAAAIREIREETAMGDVTIERSLKTITYFYNRSGLIKKTVHYFLCKTNGNEKLTAQKEEGISDVRWYHIDTASDVIGYPKTNSVLLKEAKAALERSEK